MCGQTQVPTFGKHDGPATTFPLTPEQQAALADSNAVSPTLPTDAGVVVDPSFLPPPTNPGDPGFWKEFDALLDIQIARRKNDAPAAMLDLPKLFANDSIADCAEAVHRDFPSDFPTQLVKQFLKEGAKVDPSIIPQRSKDDFSRGPVLLSQVCGWAPSAVSPSAFAAKWAYGRARPEEVAWAIAQGQLPAPREVREKVASLNLTKPEDFTAYSEGCPKHPAYPAMHSAASSASLYLAVIMDLSPEQIAEARRVDYAVAFFRSIAGVHYPSDNIAGLALGQEVIARELPQYLAQNFGADPDKVREKIAKVRHDWSAYVPRAADAATAG